MMTPGDGDAHRAIRTLVGNMLRRAIAGGEPVSGACMPTPTPALPRERGRETAGAAEVLCADEAAAFLGIDRKTVYEYAARGQIPHQRVGKRLLFSRSALVSWLAASTAGPTTARGQGA
jgi:excisionase family DNA binding protein